MNKEKKTGNEKGKGKCKSSNPKTEKQKEQKK
jgi:hypothetical protein